MIGKEVEVLCLLAGNYSEAIQWAKGQCLDKSEWFYPSDETDLIAKTNFHVLVIGTAGQNVPSSYFERIYNLAVQRGKINRP